MAKLGNPRFQPQRLTEARDFVGMTKRLLASLAGLSEQSISNYERGISNPQDNVIDRLCDILHVRREFLLSPAWPETDDHIFWRTMRSDTAQSQRRTGVLLRWLEESIQILEGYIELPEYKLPTLNLPNWKRLSDEDIEHAAEFVRSAWGFGRHPVPDVSLAIENAGIPVVAFSAENRKQAGFMHRSLELDRPIIGVNLFEQSLARQRFSLAHELGHILLHTSATRAETRNPEINKCIERQAHRFAGAFLFPRAAFEKEVYDYSLEEFSTLKRTWGISVLAQVIRARDLGLISESQVDDLYRKAGRRGFRRPMGEPWDAELPLEEPRLLRRCVEVIDQEGGDVLADFLSDYTMPAFAMSDILKHPLEMPRQELDSNVITLRPRSVGQRS